MVEKISGIFVVAILLLVSFLVGNRLYQGSRTARLGLGLGVLGYAIYFLGLLGVLYTAIVWVVLLAGLLFGLYPFVLGRQRHENLATLKTTGAALLPGKPNKSWLLYVPLALVLLLQLAGALAPESKFDSLWYHLTEAKAYVAEHHIRPYLTGQLAQSSVTPRLIDICYTLLFSISPSQFGPKLLHWALGLMLILGMGKWTSEVVGKRAGIAVMTLFAASEPISWLAQTAYIDLGYAFFGFLVLRLALKFGEKPSRNEVLRLGVFFGLFVATKLWALLLLPVIVLVLFFRKAHITHLLAFGGLVLGICAPWLLEAFIATGNPVYPVFSWNDADHTGGTGSISGWLSSEYWKRWGEAFGIIAHDMPLAILGVLSIFVSKRARPWAIVGLASLLVWTILPVRDARYVLPFMLPLAIAFGFLLKEFWEKKWGRIVISIPAVTLFLICFAILAIRSSRYLPVAVGIESNETYLEKYVAEDIYTYFDTGHWLKNNIAPGEKAALLAHNMYYADFPWVDAEDLGGARASTHDLDTLLAVLKKNGVTYFVTKGPIYSLHAWLAGIVKSSAKLTTEWMNKHFTQVYHNDIGQIEIYKVTL